jgi:hypothetical protein
MNYNIIGYGIFILFIVIIIKVVGQVCYRNGNIFVASLIPDHLDLCLQINKVLLTGYYLVNIGYAATTLITWEIISTLPQLVEVIALKTSMIICIICILHYLNIFLLTTSIQKLIKTP